MRSARLLFLATTLLLPLAAPPDASAADMAALFDDVASPPHDGAPTSAHGLDNRLYTLAANTLEPAANAGTGRIAVLYPDLGEPYRSVFRNNFV